MPVFHRYASCLHGIICSWLHRTICKLCSQDSLLSMFLLSLPGQLGFKVGYLHVSSARFMQAGNQVNLSAISMPCCHHGMQCSRHPTLSIGFSASSHAANAPALQIGVLFCISVYNTQGACL